MDTEQLQAARVASPVVAATTTDQHLQAAIAAERPDLHSALATNPALYPELREWLAQLGWHAAPHASGSAGQGAGPTASAAVDASRSPEAHEPVIDYSAATTVLPAGAWGPAANPQPTSHLPAGSAPGAQGVAPFQPQGYAAPQAGSAPARSRGRRTWALVALIVLLVLAVVGVVAVVLLDVDEFPLSSAADGPVQTAVGTLSAPAELV